MPPDPPSSAVHAPLLGRLGPCSDQKNPPDQIIEHSSLKTAAGNSASVCPIKLLTTYYTSTRLNPMWCQSSVCPIELLLTCLDPVWCWPVCAPTELLSVCLHLVWCWPVCVPIELLLVCLIPRWCWSSVCSHRAMSTCFQPVWYWSSVCSHRSIVKVIYQCDVDAVCVPIELLSTYFYLP